MSGARISFTCSTSEDADIIEWLDSFGSRERSYGIKAAIRHYMSIEEIEEQGEITPQDVSRIENLEEKISEILREIVAMRKEGLVAISNNDTMNNNLNEENKINPAVASNIGKFFED